MPLTKDTPQANPPHQHEVPAEGSGLRQLSGAERLTGLGFRCWLSGYQTGEIRQWEQAWSAYAIELGPQSARSAIRDLSCWVRAVRGHAQRASSLQPAACDGFVMTNAWRCR